MKSLLLVLFFLLVGFSALKGQVVDTAGVARGVDSLLATATKLWRAGNPQDALPIAQKATDISKKTWGENSVKFAAGLHRTASIFSSLNQIDSAEELYLKAIEIRGKVLGKKHQDYAASVNNLAIQYYYKGDYSRAEPLCLEAKEIRANTLGKDHTDYAQSLNNLGALFHNKGDYTKAELLYLEAKEIRAKNMGKEDPEYARLLYNLAGLYRDKDAYEKAELLYLEAQEIWSKTIGREHSDYAWSLDNLANLYADKGDYAKAELYYLESITIQTKTLGKENSNYALTLGNLGILYYREGDYAKAEPLYLEVLEIWAKSLGKEHPDYASALQNLAALYFSKGDYEKAEPLYMEALEIFAKTLGKEHPEYARSLSNLASLYSDKGDHSKAEPLFGEAKEILNKTIGKEHPDYAQALSNLAVLYYFKGNYDTSEDYYLEANAIYLRLIEQYESYCSGSQMWAYFHKLDYTMDRFQSFAQDYTSPELSQTSFDNALFLNGLLLENARLLSRSVAESDSLTRETYERWQGCRRRLANEYAKPIAERKYVEEVEAEAEGYEKALTRNLPAFSEARRIPHWQDVQAQLKPNEAAIEFIDFKYYTPKPTDSTLYAALILRALPAGASAKEGPKWVTLCEQRQLDALLNTNNQRTESLNQLYSPQKETVQVLDEESPALYDLVWGPLDSLLNSPSVGGGRGEVVNTVYFAPSGLLHRLNLGALPISDKQTLSDKYTLHQVNSTRELVIPTQLTPGASDAVVYGGIQYEMDTTAIRSAIAGKDSIIAPIDAGEVSFSSTSRSLRGDAWNYLPGTEKESTQVGKLLTKKGLKTTLRQGYAASEESFKKMGRDGQPSPKVLHIATHGFFFPDPKDTLQSKRWMSDREPAFKISDHPMIRSGLLMAGGNAAWTNQTRPADLEDGILTAYEISQMNLRNTELVVLSACETGLGDIQGNEGVYGLQRAFKISGAKYLLMSLWQVPDVQTQELMTTFYKEWAGSKTIPEAFREAQNIMRKKYPGKPFFWAGFVLIE